MSLLRVPGTSLVSIVAVAITSTAAAQNPGEVPIYGTYQGSMEQQRRDAEASAQVAARNQQMLDRLDETYAAYAPRSDAASGGGGGGNYVEQLKKKPLLPASRNPLIGRWQQTGATKPDIGFLREFPGVEVVDKAFGGACESVFGKGMVAFAPKALNWVAPDGHEEILNNVEYRSDGNNIIMISSDPDTLPFIFGLVDRDHAVAAFWGCTMTRVSANAKPGAVATQAAASSAPTAPAPVNQAILTMTVGEMINGALSSPPAGTRIFLTSQDPDASLIKAGFTPGPGEAPIDRLFAACKLNRGGTQERCNQGMAALTAGAVGAAATDMNGRAVTDGVAPGRYYIVGFTPYKGHSLIWHLPVDLKAGANFVTLSPDNGSISH